MPKAKLTAFVATPNYEVTHPILKLDDASVLNRANMLAASWLLRSTRDLALTLEFRQIKLCHFGALYNDFVDK